MGSRFFNISYVLNTIVIKSRAFLLAMSRGSYPYDYFKTKTNTITTPSYKLDKVDKYHSLSYLDYQSVLKLHAGSRSITQELIVGLVYSNELSMNKEFDVDYIIDLASKLRAQSEFSENEMIFYFDEPYDRFDLKGKYYSGIVQGKAASFFLKCYQHTEDEKYREWAKKCLLSAWKPAKDDGVLRQLSYKNYWVEEYPSPNPSMVLNGFLFYIIGLAEYLALEEDATLKSHFELCLNSVLSWMPNYRLKNGLLYSMYRWSFCNVHYTGIMKYQFEHLYQLTGVSMFKEYAEFTDMLTNWKTFRQITQTNQ